MIRKIGVAALVAGCLTVVPATPSYADDHWWTVGCVDIDDGTYCFHECSGFYVKLAPEVEHLVKIAITCQ